MKEHRDDRDHGSLERLGERLGATTGGAVGRGADAAAGMMGSLLDSAIGALGDWWSSAAANRAAQSFLRERDESCREHFDSIGIGSGRDYDEVRPLYQFGHVAGQNPNYRGRDFSEVEPELRRAWSRESTDTHGDWPEVRGFVGFGYTRESGSPDL
jgi:hypothetical protein